MVVVLGEEGPCVVCEKVEQRDACADSGPLSGESSDQARDRSPTKTQHVASPDMLPTALAVEVYF